jgi:hypothetical protein
MNQIVTMSEVPEREFPRWAPKSGQQNDCVGAAVRTAFRSAVRPDYGANRGGEGLGVDTFRIYCAGTTLVTASL